MPGVPGVGRNDDTACMKKLQKYRSTGQVKWKGEQGDGFNCKNLGAMGVHHRQKREEILLFRSDGVHLMDIGLDIRTL